MKAPLSAYKIGATAYWMSRLLMKPPPKGAGLARHQLSRMRSILSQTWRSCPFYRRRMEESGVRPELPGGLEEFRRLPVLGREEYRDFVESPEWENARLTAAAVDRTSGSTGRPITVYRSQDECARIAAMFFRALFANGYGIRDTTFQICLPGEETVRSGRFWRLGLLGGISVSCLKEIDSWIDAYRRFRPEIIYACRTHLIQMALHMMENGISLLPPKLCVSFGETLDGKSRNLLMTAFRGAPVVQTYGTTEFGTLGYEAPGAPFFHIYNETNYFELESGPAGEGSQGTLIVTDLYPRLFPLIRYRMGDRVLFGMEEGVPVLRSLLGRDNDFIRLADGKICSSHVFAMIMERRPGILQFRLVQPVPEELDIYYVARSDSDTPTYEREIAADIQRDVSPTLRVRLNRASRIDPELNGKLRCVIRCWEEA